MSYTIDTPFQVVDRLQGVRRDHEGRRSDLALIGLSEAELDAVADRSAGDPTGLLGASFRRAIEAMTGERLATIAREIDRAGLAQPHATLRRRIEAAGFHAEVVRLLSRSSPPSGINLWKGRTLLAIAPYDPDADVPKGSFGIVIGIADVGAWTVEFGGAEQLRIDRPLPDTVLATLPGSRASVLIDHPLTTDGGPVIATARRVGNGFGVTFAAEATPSGDPT